MGFRHLADAGKIGRCFLVAINILFVLLGVALIIVGVYGHVHKSTDGRITEMLRNTELVGFNLGNIIVVLSVTIIIVGVFTVAVSVNGGLGAYLKKKWLLIMYVIIVLLILILQVALFVVWCKFTYGTNNWLKQQMDNLLRYYNGIQGADDVYSRGWNLLFVLIDCCASSSPLLQNDFLTLGTFWWLNPFRQLDQIPYTCCKEATIDNYLFGRNLQCTVNMDPQLYRHRGCYEALHQIMTDVSAAAIAITVILIVTEVLAVIAAIMMIRSIKHEVNGRMDSVNSNVYRKSIHEIAMPDHKLN